MKYGILQEGNEDGIFIPQNYCATPFCVVRANILTLNDFIACMTIIIPIVHCASDSNSAYQDILVTIPKVLLQAKTVAITTFVYLMASIFLSERDCHGNFHECVANLSCSVCSRV